MDVPLSTHSYECEGLRLLSQPASVYELKKILAVKMYLKWASILVTHSSTLRSLGKGQLDMERECELKLTKHASSI
jgi:arsenate reductase-like glutaredoxin family protein